MDAIRSFATALLIPVALICAGWSLAAHGGRWSARLDVLAHFAPVILAVSLACLFYGLAIERGTLRLWMAGLGSVAAISAALLMAPEYLRPLGASASNDATRQLKLIQFNAWGGNRDLPGSVAWLKAQAPDILIVQEAWIIGPMLQAALEGYHVSCERCGVRIFSKARPLATSLPGHDPDDRRRPAMAAATFVDDIGPFTVYGAHLVWPVYGDLQQAQGRVIADLLRSGGDRQILAGDFNSTPWSFARRREDDAFGLQRRTRAVFSWPTTRFSVFGLATPWPLLPIDHVYAGNGWRTVKVERGPRLGSDHFPVVVILAPSP